jgi:hypothetical protein
VSKSRATPLLAPAIVSAPPRPRGASAQQKYDEMRRPQAALLFRALKAAEHKGMAWRECFALCEEPGAVVVWMRAHGVDVDAVYDVGGGETRFYLIEPARPLAVGPIPDDGASGGPS